MSCYITEWVSFGISHLTVDHADNTAVVTGGQALSRSRAGCISDHALLGKVVLGTTTTSQASETSGTAAAAATTEETTKELAELALALVVTLSGARRQTGEVVLGARGAGSAVVGGRRVGTAHVAGNDGVGVNGTVALGAAKSGGTATAHVAVADDGGVGLGAAAVGGAVSGRAVGNCVVLGFWSMLAVL